MLEHPSAVRWAKFQMNIHRGLLAWGNEGTMILIGPRRPSKQVHLIKNAVELQALFYTMKLRNG